MRQIHTIIVMAVFAIMHGNVCQCSPLSQGKPTGDSLSTVSMQRAIAEHLAAYSYLLPSAEVQRLACEALGDSAEDESCGPTQDAMVVVKLRRALADSLAAQGETSRALAMYRSVLTELNRVDGANEKCGRLMAARVAVSAARLHLSAGEYAEVKNALREPFAVPFDNSIDEPSRVDLAIEMLEVAMAVTAAEGRTSGALASTEQFYTALTSGPAQSNRSWQARLDLLRAPLFRAEGMSSVALQLESTAKTALLEHIARDGRFDPSSSSLLCTALLELGYSQLESSDPLSMESYREAAVVARSLQDHDPDDYGYMDLMARAQCGIAQGLMEAGAPVSALTAVDLAVSAATDACSRCASDLMIATILARAFLLRGDVFESMELHKDALKSWRLGLEKLRIPKADQSPPDVAEIRAALVSRIEQKRNEAE